jgi:hypothetical protein
MFKFKDKELRKELKRVGLIKDDRVWESHCDTLTAEPVVRECKRLYELMNALCDHLGIVPKECNVNKKYQFVKRKKAKDE